ncbi:hypothetical protein L1857_19650 [Amycolatopsis thermalba]|uniref:Uncharacterized protein n=1 Tax=Amycolatopsis thermalba TaxID=944492 RepID=A0ABY4NXV5_9PSEU|nr:hypothetical protein L1857_19650 [Amycolatopsis thermalba]
MRFPWSAATRAPGWSRPSARTWLCSDYARLITGCDLVVDGGARAKNFACHPAPAGELAGPAPLIPLEPDRG